MSNEQVHRYPRRITITIELLAAISVAVALALFGRDLLRLYWEARGVDATYFDRLPFLRDLVLAVVGRVPSCCGPIRNAMLGLIPALGWLALVLLLALLLRYSLPTIRTSARGLLVEFAGDWLPVPWESVRAIKVTDADSRYVLLVETDGRHMTGWHRFYSFIYRLGFRPGFLVTSAIDDFDGVVRTLLSETDRVARVLEGAKGAQLQEEASSPLFRLLINPASFFSQRTAAEQPQAAAPVAQVAAGDPVVGSYPTRISGLLRWGANVLTALFALRAAILILTLLALVLPFLTAVPPFTWLQLRVLPQPWWLVVAAGLVLLAMLAVTQVVRNLLPEVAARSDGLAVRYNGRWALVPWQRLQAVKVTELSEDSRILIIQTNGGLPPIARVSSLIYDGTLQPGILVTSALSNFEPLMQRIVLEVMRNPGPGAQVSDRPIFQDDAPSSLLLLALSSGQGIDRIVEDIRADPDSKQLSAPRLLGAAAPMAALALLPPLILFADRTIQQGLVPDVRLFLVMVVLFVLGMLEWPLVSIGSVALDETTGGGEEGYRAFYLYPLAQLPRILTLLLALLAVILAVPYLPTLLWLGTLVWVFLLAAGLWGDLYDWRGGQLVAGGLIPVVFLLLLLIGYLVLRS